MFKNKKVPTELPVNATYGEAYGPLEYIEDKEEAVRYLQILINHLVTHKGKTEEDAREICLHNIGYWSGYYDAKTAKRIIDLFDTVHPIFGKSHTDGSLTPEKVFKAGQELAKKGDRDV